MAAPLARNETAMNTRLGASLLTALSVFAVPGAAEAAARQWRFEAALYGWVSEVDGDIAVRDNASGEYWLVRPETFFEGTTMLFGARLEASNGLFGGFLDLTYVGYDDTGPVRFVTAEAIEPIEGEGELEHTGGVATFAGSLSLTNHPRYPTQFFLGGRYIDVDTDLSWTIDDSVSLPPFLGHKGTADSGYSAFDGIAGLRGRVYLSPKRKAPWFISYYADAGAGESDLTWQAALGAGFRFTNGDLSLVWRHLQYDVPSDAMREDFHFTGPVFSAAFRFGGTARRRR
jgi:hypothetical protein